MALRKSKKLNQVSKAKSKIQKRKSVRNKKSRKRTYRKKQKGGTTVNRIGITRDDEMFLDMENSNDFKKYHSKFVVYDSVGNKYYLYFPNIDQKQKYKHCFLKFLLNKKQDVNFPDGNQPFEQSHFDSKSGRTYNSVNEQDRFLEEVKRQEEKFKKLLYIDILHKYYRTIQTSQQYENEVEKLIKLLGELFKLIEEVNRNNKDIIYHFKLEKLIGKKNPKEVEWCQDIISFVSRALNKTEPQTGKYLIGDETYAFSYVSPTVCRLDIKRDLIEGLAKKLKDIKDTTATTAPVTTAPTAPTAPSDLPRSLEGSMAF